ncbi:coenzyme PQQ synthesis D (plasmid) [Cupriavidus necator N-1]|uniref:Coenzyme PQQ synthesis D n=1 Tax=Cupriavidus necator (strain ATCC 43291 / DSM 13513 / CCUG 52238 / LMG 8453 / N-1) TaxID=1042878 RepID=F8GWZ2_CUPNN|nr:pyrroloquinoline quinone biosynthesis peptide chaperone PqqD [Cupriavidus necator]AEI81862.1 coenzyme PQQ synthesis D [Cupriavidus necator N-1]MDX6008189.1 pyrroloquinoline quinone biosynthesis peptide chaperone PqqD [Cupriavidus necator]
MTEWDLSTPVLNVGFRLQWEAAQQAHVLLFPEGMIRLNVSAAEILKRCDGTRVTDELVTELETVFSVQGIRAEVQAFLAHATQRGWVGWVRE